jgi:predicted GH43/DUF377 family glycosyl hydrolase
MSLARRLDLRLDPDPSRVLLRTFLPSLVVRPTGSDPSSQTRLEELVQRVAELDSATVADLLEQVRGRFACRHRDQAERVGRHAAALPAGGAATQAAARLDPARRALLGCYLSSEYALEAAALFNPSVVPHADQGGLEEGELRFVLSLRATGEGHVSSITFRSGVIAADGQVRLEPVSPFVQEGVIAPAASAGDYSVTYGPDSGLCERVLFPVTGPENNGLEDARFVAFDAEDGRRCWYATATAYDGRSVSSRLIHTEDFHRFEVSSLRGRAVVNKGLALFPRKLGGSFWMLGRQDGRSLSLMRSDRLDRWDGMTPLLEPCFPWEYIQVGNCGSPLETEAGWLVLTHGVGPMRQYAIGAALLDRHDPQRLLGRMRQPLLVPTEEERDGYVPNVVYSCGALIHAGQLLLPYAISDRASRFALVPLAPLLEELLASPPP